MRMETSSVALSCANVFPAIPLSKRNSTKSEETETRGGGGWACFLQPTVLQQISTWSCEGGAVELYSSIFFYLSLLGLKDMQQAALTETTTDIGPYLLYKLPLWSGALPVPQAVGVSVHALFLELIFIWLLEKMTRLSADLDVGWKISFQRWNSPGISVP